VALPPQPLTSDYPISRHPDLIDAFLDRSSPQPPYRPNFRRPVRELAGGILIYSTPASRSARRRRPDLIATGLYRELPDDALLTEQHFLLWYLRCMSTSVMLGLSC
jgi:hypothetical protein